MQSIGLPEKVLHELNLTLYKFIWQRRHTNRRAFEKVKRVVMESDPEYGGLKMLNINDMQRAFYLQWVAKLKASNGQKWTLIPLYLISKVVKGFGIFNFNAKPSKIGGLGKIKNAFWKTVITTWLSEKHITPLEQVDESNFSHQSLWYNELVKYRGSLLYYHSWQARGFQTVQDIIKMDERRLLSMDEVKGIVGDRGTMMFEYNALVNALPKQWMQWVQTSDGVVDHHDLLTFNGMNVHNYKAKDFRLLLKEKKIQDLNACAVGFWKRKFAFALDKEVWKKINAATKETRLRELQWKILHNIYPTNILLSKMKVKSNNKCIFCPGEVDYIEHFFFDCCLVRKFWKYVEGKVLQLLSNHVTITMTDVLFGLQERKDLNQGQVNMIDHILMIGKMCISIKKKTNSSTALPIFSLATSGVQKHHTKVNLILVY